MRFAHVVVGADDATPENRKEAFNRVRMLQSAVRDVLPRAVADGRVRRKRAPHVGLDRAFVSN